MESLVLKFQVTKPELSYLTFWEIRKGVTVKFPKETSFNWYDNEAPSALIPTQKMGGGGRGGEMTQALYAYMNNKK
jgi:hypothetical protein